jgi:hypothetical protein
VNESEPKARLDVLDPAVDDPGYWLRFQRIVVQRARPALAERRRSHVALEDVVFVWGRWVLPAVAAAIVAALLATRDAPSARAEDVAGVEQVLERPTGAEPLPSFLHGESGGKDLVLLAVELR